MTSAEAVGITSILACLFCTVSWTLMRRPFQSVVDLAMSSPTFFGDCSVCELCVCACVVYMYVRVCGVWMCVRVRACVCVQRSV